jgi:predicted HNH restriction endonuclease
MFRKSGLQRRGGLSGLNGRNGRNGRTTSFGKGGVVKLRQTYPDDWQELRLKVLERDGYRCRRCNTNLRGVFYREVHHIVPLARGGTNHMSNLSSLCSDCHATQHR